MIFTDVLQDLKVDVKDQERVLFLQKVYQAGYDQGMHDTHSNIEYNEKVAEILPRIRNLLDMTADLLRLAVLEDALNKTEIAAKKRRFLEWTKK